MAKTTGNAEQAQSHAAREAKRAQNRQNRAKKAARLAAEEGYIARARTQAPQKPKKARKDGLRDPDPRVRAAFEVFARAAERGTRAQSQATTSMGDVLRGQAPQVVQKAEFVNRMKAGKAKKAKERKVQAVQGSDLMASYFGHVREVLV